MVDMVCTTCFSSISYCVSTLSTQINWSNAVVIFDEAHNLESVASDASSFELTSAQIAGAQEEALRCHKLYTEGGVDEVS